MAHSFSNFHQIPSSYEPYGSGLDISSSIMTNNIETTAVNIVKDKLGLADGDVTYTSGYSSDILHYAYLKQSHNGIPFINAVANLALAKDGELATFGSSFIKPDNIASSKPTIQLDSAIRTAEQKFNGSYNEHPTRLEYYAQPDGSAVLVHVIQIQNSAAGVWVEVNVDAHSHQEKRRM